MDLIHRDDVPPELLEELAEKFPGFTIVCAGDARGELPADFREACEQVENKFANSLAHGTCIDCGAQMPGYDGIDSEEWQPAEGWRWFSDMATDQIQAWQCPQCDAKDIQEGG